MRPIDLGLEPGRGLKPHLGPAWRLRSRPVDIPAHSVIPAVKPIVTHEVLVDPRRQQPRLASEPLIDQRLEPVELRRHPPAAIRRLRTMLEIPLHRPPIPAQQPADLRVGVALTRKRPDVHQFLLADQPDLPLDDDKAVERHGPAGQNQPGGFSGCGRARRDRRPLRGSSPDARVTSLRVPTDLHISMRTEQHYSMLMGTES